MNFQRWLVWLLLLGWVSVAWSQAVCRFCKGQLLLESFSYRDGEFSVCLNCRKAPRCSLCSNPSPGKPYRDGRQICPGCLKTGMFDKGRVSRLATQVQTYLQQLLGKEGTADLPPIQLVDWDEMQTKFIESGRSMEVAAFYRPYNPEMVYLLTGETELESCSHLAHELTHAWQSRACPSQDRALKEGMACWVQYQYLLSRGARAEAERITRHQDPDYGASLVKLLQRSQALGNARFLQAVRKASKLGDI